MKNQHTKLLAILIAAACFTVFIQACSNNSVGTTNDELTDCLGEKVPFPATATITACIGPQSDRGVIKGATFEPGISWSESLSFFSRHYSSGEWDLFREDIDSHTSGEREAEWRAYGPNFDVIIWITAFGDENIGFMVGGIGMYEKGTI